MFKKLPNSTRKFIRFEKARIRRQFLDYKAQEEAIANMYNKILNQPLGHSPLGRSPTGEPTGEAVIKKAEVVESIKFKETSPKKPLAVAKRARQKKETTKKTKIHRNKKGKK